MRNVVMKRRGRFSTPNFGVYKSKFGACKSNLGTYTPKFGVENLSEDFRFILRIRAPLYKEG